MKIIELTREQVAIVDDDDYEYLKQFKWRALNIGDHWYAVRSARGKGDWKANVFMHRDIMKIEDNKVFIDHINHNSLDNRKINLRACTNRENVRNSRKSRRNTSGFKGVHKQGKRWVAMINSKYLGLYASPREAALAYDEAASEMFGEFAKTNKMLGLL